MNDFLNSSAAAVRKMMDKVAGVLNKLSGGKLSPNFITITGLFAHLPIAWLIGTQNYHAAAVWLVIFGLFDTLDGAMARLQGKASSAGMLLDATTDRAKEVILYIGIASGLISQISGNIVAFIPMLEEIRWSMIAVVAACGGSLLVSYVKAKGETAVAGKVPDNEINRLFQDGLMRFEVRMFVLVAGLLTGWLVLAVILIAILSWLTALMRLINISRALAR